MSKSATQPSLTTADMELADAGLSPEQKASYSSLVNWQTGQSLLIAERYRIERYLGRGGFGLVFAAIDQQTDQSVAVKFIHPGQTVGKRHLRRIEREFELAQKLRHPGLVRLHSLEEWRGLFFLVMDLIPGQTLSDWILARGPQPWSVVAPLAGQLIDVLAAIHQAGAIHRDIKPSNLILTPDNRLILLDLGLTRELDDTQKTSSTGELIGSPHYLPPELILGKKITPAADLYQFGLVIYFLLSGCHPFAVDDQNTALILGRQLTSPLHLPKAKAMPMRQRLVIGRCLEKNPAMRPRDACELLRLLDKHGYFARLRRYLQLRRPLRSGLLTGLVLLTALSTFLYFSLPASRIVEDSQDLIARNALGRELWRKTPGEAEKLGGWLQGQDESGRLSVSAVYSPRQHPYRYTLDTIRADQFPIVRRVWDNRGRDRFQPDNPIDYGFMDYFDFYPIADLKQALRRDIDGDGQPELVLFIGHAGNMFPTLMTVFGQEKFPRLALFCPGIFSLNGMPADSPILNPAHSEKAGFLAISNPFCHYHVWAWNLRTEQFLGNLAIPPSFIDIASNFLKTTQLIFLPSRSWITRNNWSERGELELTCADSQLTLSVERNGRVRFSGNSSREFTENFPANSAALALLNRLYYHVVRQEADQARLTAGQIVDNGIRNPWLLAIIAYFRGETALISGQGDVARTWYLRALEYDPFNADARNRLCELAVTQDGPLQGLKYHQDNSRYASSFWGLGIHGQALFQLCCRLMAGQTFSVSQVQQLVDDDLPSHIDMEGFARNYQALACLYSSRHADLAAVIAKMLEEYEAYTILPFDISELQLMLARLWMVNGDRAKAEPFLRHYATETVLHKPFAETSLAWCQAESGEGNDARKRADQAFGRIRFMARSQFWARYWLFYDAYAYGRTMELLGENAKAREAYRLCSELAPFSFLGQDARRRADR